MIDKDGFTNAELEHQERVGDLVSELDYEDIQHISEDYLDFSDFSEALCDLISSYKSEVDKDSDKEDQYLMFKVELSEMMGEAVNLDSDSLYNHWAAFIFKHDKNLFDEPLNAEAEERLKND